MEKILLIKIKKMQSVFIIIFFSLLSKALPQVCSFVICYWLRVCVFVTGAVKSIDQWTLLSTCGNFICACLKCLLKILCVGHC